MGKLPEKVLIADDTELCRVELTDILTGAGYEVVGAAANGREALIMAGRLKPDIVILDIIMPEMNGLEAAREITALDLPTTIIMCSSLGHEAIINDAVTAGASGYILKPFNEETVIRAIKQATGGGQAENS